MLQFTTLGSKLYKSFMLKSILAKIYIKDNNSAPQYLPFYNVEIEKEKGVMFKDFVLHFTTLIVPFSQREVSLHSLLEIH